jgi:hypothetical protein
VRIKIVLATGLLLIALAVAVVLSHAPQTLARTNAIPITTTLAGTNRDTLDCQTDETLPRDTSAVRLGLFTLLGPRITVKIFADSRVITEGTRSPGWDATDIAVALKEVAHTVSPVTVCFGLEAVNSEVSYVGSRTPRASAMTSAGKPLPGRIRIEYLQPGHATWWSLAGSVVRNIGFGHAIAGSLNVVIVTTLATAMLTLLSWLIVRELR